jgi:hypothetical protein
MMAAVLTVLLAALLALGSWLGADGKTGAPAQRAAQLELDRLAAFAYATRSFVDTHPGFNGRVSWQGGAGRTALLGKQTTPPAWQPGMMPTDWEAVVSAGSFTLCAPLSPAALRLMLQRMPVAAGSVAHEGRQYIVVDEPAARAAQAARCAGG